MASKTKTESIYLPLKDFPYLERYTSQFQLDLNDVAFPYKGKIYSNKELPAELLAHETVHFKQQEEIGADEWEERYLKDANFRVKMEIEAYKKQLTFYTANKDVYEAGRMAMAKVLSSLMYGNILTYQEAYHLLK
jgi:hypothetical protein